MVLNVPKSKEPCIRKIIASSIRSTELDATKHLELAEHGLGVTEQMEMEHETTAFSTISQQHTISNVVESIPLNNQIRSIEENSDSLPAKSRLVERIISSKSKPLEKLNQRNRTYNTRATVLVNPNGMSKKVLGKVYIICILKLIFLFCLIYIFA